MDNQINSVAYNSFVFSPKVYAFFNNLDEKNMPAVPYAVHDTSSVKHPVKNEKTTQKEDFPRHETSSTYIGPLKKLKIMLGNPETTSASQIQNCIQQLRTHCITGDMLNTAVKRFGNNLTFDALIALLEKVQEGDIFENFFIRGIEKRCLISDDCFAYNLKLLLLACDKAHKSAFTEGIVDLMLIQSETIKAESHQVAALITVLLNHIGAINGIGLIKRAIGLRNHCIPIIVKRLISMNRWGEYPYRSLYESLHDKANDLQNLFLEDSQQAISSHEKNMKNYSQLVTAVLNSASCVTQWKSEIRNDSTASLNPFIKLLHDEIEKRQRF